MKKRRGGRRRESRDESAIQFRRQLVLALAAGVLSVLSALAGAWVASSSADSVASRQWEQSVYQQRSALLERTVRQASSLAAAGVLKTSAEVSIASSSLTTGAADIGESLDRVTQSSKSIVDMQGEFAATIALDMIWFGPRTQKSAGELADALEAAPVWWEVDEQKTQALIDAMAGELRYGMDD